MHKTVVVIPTYNNPKTIKSVVDDVLSFGYDVIVVDDGSDMHVSQLIQNHHVTVVRHEKTSARDKRY